MQQNTVLTGDYLQTRSGSCGSYGNPTSTCGYLGVDVQFSNQTGDRMTVLGKADVSGAVVTNILNPGQALPGGHDITLIHTTNGVTNSGLIVQSQPSAVVNWSVYFPNGYDVVLHYGIDFSPAGLTVNQHSVGNAINQIQSWRLSPLFTPVAAALLYQPNFLALGHVYDSLSGEGVATAQQTSFNAINAFSSSMGLETNSWLRGQDHLDPHSNTHYEPMFLGYAPQETAPAAFAPYKSAPTPIVVPLRTWRAWVDGNGSSSNYAGVQLPTGSAYARNSGAGTAAGLDYQFAHNALLGFAIGYGSYSFSVPDRETSGSTQGGHFGLYGALTEGAAYASASASFGFFENHELRHAGIPGTTLPSLFNTPVPSITGFNEYPEGKFGSNAFAGTVELGYRSRFASYEVTPFVGVQPAVLNTNGFAENNSGGWGGLSLQYTPKSTPSVPTLLGAQVSTSFGLWDQKSVSLWARAAWKHEFFTDRWIEGGFLTAPGFNFTIYGAPAIRDAARIGLGGQLPITENLSIYANFNGDFGGQGQSLAGSGGLRASW